MRYPLEDTLDAQDELDTALYNTLVLEVCVRCNPANDFDGGCHIS